MFGIGVIELVILLVVGLGGLVLMVTLVVALSRRRAGGQVIVCPHCGKQLQI